MKKMNCGIASAVLGLALLALPVVAKAQTVERFQVTNLVGAITWTNGAANAPFTLDKIRASGIQPADSTSVWKRVTREGFTNTILAAQVGASGAFEIDLTNDTAFLKGDLLVVTGMGTNSNARTQLEGSVP